MSEKSGEGPQRRIESIGERHGFSAEAARAAASALAAGHGSMAQFNHPELGGMGQWSRGGMLMIGDMFNDGLKGRVRALIDDLAALDPAEIAGSAPGQGGGSVPKRWWPEELGQPATSGGQNDQLYAVFPAHRRLALKRGERVTIHDTGDHRIGGASQQQGAGRSLSFSTPEGSIVADDLPIVAEF